MVELRQLVEYCDLRLEAARFEDYCPNGLQVEASGAVSRICTGVTASLALIGGGCRGRRRRAARPPRLFLAR